MAKRNPRELRVLQGVADARKSFPHGMVPQGYPVKERRVPTDRDLSRVCHSHGVNFLEVSEQLMREFGCSEEKPLRVLDVGCGKSSFLHELKNHFKDRIEVVGLDVVRLPDWVYFPRVTYRVGHANNLSAVFRGSAPFHLVVSTHGGMFYSKDVPGAVREALKVTALNGHVYAHLPDGRYPFESTFTGPERAEVLKGQELRGQREISFHIVKKSET